jgi:hypothetical protein
VHAGEIDRCLDLPAGWLIREYHRPHQRPIELALANDGFLPILVFVDPFQEKRQYQAIEEKAAMATAISCA